jgi:hypothetical protein
MESMFELLATLAEPDPLASLRRTGGDDSQDSHSEQQTEPDQGGGVSVE